MGKIYEFRMSDWDNDSITKMINDTNYSDAEFKDICANLYIEESFKSIENFKKTNNWIDEDIIHGRINYYKKATALYDSVCTRLFDEYGFKELEIYSSFFIDSDESFDTEPENLNDYDFDIDLIRKKYKNKLRENKLKKIIK